MKKRYFIFSAILILLIQTSLLATSLNLFTTDSDEYKVAYSLCISNGVNPPTVVSPMTGYEIEQALERIPQSRLDNNEQKLYDEIISRLNKDMTFETEYVDISPMFIISPEIYAHTTKLDRPFDFKYDLKDRTQLLDFSLDIKIKDYIYMFGDWTILSPRLDRFHDIKLGSNVHTYTKGIHFEGVINSGIYAAKEYGYGGIFTTKQSIGNGKTGNLIVSDNFSRQEFARYKIHSPYFDYTFNWTTFSQSEPTTSNKDVTLSAMKFNGMNQYQIVHRLEAKLFDNLQISLNEAIMLDVSKAFNIKYLNPFTFFHGLSNSEEDILYKPGNASDEANNYFSIEAGYTITPNLRANFQFLADQIQLPREQGDSNLAPEAYGILFNIESPWIQQERIYNFYFETAIIWPYTYLNKKQNDTNKDGKLDDEYNTNLDMITGYHNRYSGMSEIGYAGYTNGSDSISNTIGVTITELGLFNVDLSVDYVIHGKNGYGYDNIIAERGHDNCYDKPLVGLGFKKAEHRLAFNLDSTYYVNADFKVNLGLALVNYWNYKLEYRKNISDLQFKLGFSLNLG